MAPSPTASGTTLQVKSGDGVLFPSTPFYVTAHPADDIPTIANAEKLQVSAGLPRCGGHVQRSRLRRI